MSEMIVKTRSYTCFGAECDGAVKGLDAVPKEHGRAAVCWSCGSDLFTVPRYGASDAAVLGNPKVPKPGTFVPHLTAWQQVFAGLTIPGSPTP
jgi:hypothetical protein